MNFSFGTPKTTAPTGGVPTLNFGSGNVQTSAAQTPTAKGAVAVGSVAPLAVSTSSSPVTLPSVPATVMAAATAAITAPPPQTGLTFAQIEEMLNKWTLELEEQGKTFINQALQLNAWDRLVIANGEKILTLNAAVEKVRQQQQQLDHELEFVLIQQRELEECISPLEKDLRDVPVADHDRNHTYQMAESMDTQLKQMSEDLKEIIEHLNESNRREDSDPVSQIGRILNAHMNSLQWIDRNTAQITTLLDHIANMHDMHRRNNERSFHLTYE